MGIITNKKTVSVKLSKKEETIAEISKLLAQSVVILKEEKDDKGEGHDRAAWRIADAGVMLRQLMNAEKDWAGKRVSGFNLPTGRGALLPNAEK